MANLPQISSVYQSVIALLESDPILTAEQRNNLIACFHEIPTLKDLGKSLISQEVASIKEAAKQKYPDCGQSLEIDCDFIQMCISMLCTFDGSYDMLAANQNSTLLFIQKVKRKTIDMLRNYRYDMYHLL